MDKTLEASVRYLKGVGPGKAKVLNNLGINTIEDLLYYFPRCYEDRRNLASIKDLKAGQTQTIKAEVLAKGQRQSFKRRGFNIFELAVGDSSGKIFCVWFNRPYLKDYFKIGETLILYGRIERYGQRLQLNSPEFEIISGEQDEVLNIGRIVPIYHLPQGLTQRTLRRLIREALDKYLSKVNDFLPFDIRSRDNLLNLAKALIEIHFPQSFTLQKMAYERLSFEEFFLFQTLIGLRKLKKKGKQGIVHKVNAGSIKNFIAGLPFELTKAQKAVIKEISADMARPEPMQRLLQGDVGSGKTLVAVIAALIAIEGGYQVAFMVPTEVLAKQHFEKISPSTTLRTDGERPFDKLRVAPSEVEGQSRTIRSQGKKIKLGLLVSSLNKKQKEKVYQEIKTGKIDLIIGTHALLEENVKFRNLGLVVIDEQHKFGVGQRALLSGKGPNPDVLIMTATPIPRTLAITLYGDLDISVINELPPGRLPIKTMCFTREEKAKAYAVAKEQLGRGRQVYIVYPVIEESYALDILGAKKMHERLKDNEFKEFRVGLIHGKIKQSEQDRVMSKFINKELDVLVTTTVLEVGIDIPNATCMIIEHAERFGLSQQHQLRGRVGRGPYESFCILVPDSQTEEAKARIAAMLNYGDGFRIAEEDLKIRGPGEFFGKRQSGLSELKIANPLTQLQLLKRAREEAVRLVNKDPLFRLRQSILLRKKLLQRFPEYEKLMLVG